MAALFLRLHWATALAVVLALGPAVRAGEIPDWLPHYDLDIHFDVDQHRVTVRERVIWTNRHARPADDIVLNVYPRYQVPKEDLPLVAKTLELLRAPPSDAIDSVGRRLTIQRITLSSPAARGGAGWMQGPDLPFAYRDDNQTALVVPLPQAVQQGEKIALEIEFVLDLPEKQGRWGYWQGINFLVNWYPILAYYDETGWQPTPFVPWHLPFFNEAGSYSVWLELPADQKVASSGTLHESAEGAAGFKKLHLVTPAARDFAIICSNRFEEYAGDAEGTKVRVLALPEHEFLARKALDVACEAIPIYNRWFGKYPFAEFDIAESHFPWNGNQCGGMIMIDSRVFSMPHLGDMYIDHLVSHETLHQWWYNVVGTNGYCETWMDEGVVCYFTARRIQAKYGYNAAMLRIPHSLEPFIPNLYHENYRFYGMYNTIRHKEYTATCQPLPDFGNVFTLFSMTYDRGAKLLGMITERLGDAAFMDFMRLVYAKYQFRVIRVADFQRELEAYTGRSWKEFFDQWFYAKGMSDWAVEKVVVSPSEPLLWGEWLAHFGPCEQTKKARAEGYWLPKPSYSVVVKLRQNGEFTEETVLGVKMKDNGPYDIRIPIIPGSGPIDIEEPHMPLGDAVGKIANVSADAGEPDAQIGNLPYKAHVEPMPDGKTILVTIELPEEPVQISVDPDQLIPDSDPTNNHWKCPIRYRITPLMTNLDETDLMTDYDKWNVTAGPWIGLSNPAYGQHPQGGFRAGVYRLQEFVGGIYSVYDAYTGDVRMGGDALLQNCPCPNVDLGFQMDHSMIQEMSHSPKTEGILFGRYVFHQTASLYMEPMEYLEVYGRTGAVFWPGWYGGRSDFGRFQDVAASGIYYQRNYLTPYWDPEAGYRLWVNAEYGNALTNGEPNYEKLQGELSYVQCLPDGLGYLSDTRIAVRAYGGIGGPNYAQLFQLGGPTRIRGMNWNTRDGNALWIASAEWRFPIWKDADCDLCDHVFRARHFYGVAFYDAGEMFQNSHSVGGVVHSLGAGLRMDVAVFSFIERFTLRLDVAKMMETNEPMQMWVGLSHAF